MSRGTDDRFRVSDVVLAFMSFVTLAIAGTLTMFAYNEFSAVSESLMYSERRGELPVAPFPYLLTLSLTLIGGFSYLLSFIFARNATATASCRQEFSIAQSFVYPIVILGAAICLLSLALMPALCIVAYGGAPAIFGLSEWSFGGTPFGDVSKAKYWTKVFGTAACFFGLWSIAMAAILRNVPSLLSALIQPVHPKGISMSGRAIGLFGAFILILGVSLLAIGFGLP